MAKRKGRRVVDKTTRFPTLKGQTYNQKLLDDIKEAEIIGGDPDFFPSDMDVNYNGTGLPTVPEGMGRRTGRGA